MQGHCVLFDASDAGDARKVRKQVSDKRKRRNDQNTSIEAVSIPASRPSHLTETRRLEASQAFGLKFSSNM